MDVFLMSPSWSKAQQEARSHPRMIQTQSALLSMFSAPPQTQISLLTPLVYSDRLRIRHPGDAKFALGPHMDGGSIERWEDVDYRKVFDNILTGKWEEFDAWEMGEFDTRSSGRSSFSFTDPGDLERRAVANHDMYPGPGSVSKPPLCSTMTVDSWSGETNIVTSDWCVPLVSRMDFSIGDRSHRRDPPRLSAHP